MKRPFQPSLKPERLLCHPHIGGPVSDINRSHRLSTSTAVVTYRTEPTDPVRIFNLEYVSTEAVLGWQDGYTWMVPAAIAPPFVHWDEMALIEVVGFVNVFL